MSKKIKMICIALGITILQGSVTLPIFSNVHTVYAAEKYSDDASVDNKVNFNTDVIYQIVTDRFYDGDTANNPKNGMYDGNKKNLKKYFGGDWKGITDKIKSGYLNDMGITALWISQPVENIYSVFSDGSTSYHGYWARDFKKTNPAFGNMEDFKNLVKTAHENNIKVVIDFAPNHTSPTSKGAEDGALYDNGKLIATHSNDPNKIFNHNGGTDFSTIENGIYKNLYDLADLNHENATVDTYLKESINKWLDMGIDGIRMDAVKHMPEGWQKNFMDSVYNHKQVFTFGEWFLGKGENDPKNVEFANNSGMNLLDFRYAQKIREVFRDGSDNMYGLNKVIEDTAKQYDHVNDQVTFIDNHDMDRFHTENGDKRNVDEALVCTLTSRGIPAIYYGTEQYMTGNGDPYNRAMMTGFDENTTAYKIIQKLSKLRKTNPAIAYGTTEQRWINNDVYIYERKFGNNVVLVAINNSESNSCNIKGAMTSLPKGNYESILNSVTTYNNIEVGDNGNIKDFTLKPGATAVWSYIAKENNPIIGHVGNSTVEPGKTLTIDGRGFGNSKGKVNIAGKEGEVLSWNDREIKVKVPNVAPGKVTVSLTSKNGVKSNEYKDINVLTGKQVCVRFVVKNAKTLIGENIYLSGDVSELGNWNPDRAIGAMYNQIEYKYPNWYFDVSVPAGKEINFKFIKKKGNQVIWESGNNHVYKTPTDSTGIVTVDWQN